MREIHISPGSEEEIAMEEVIQIAGGQKIPVLSDERRSFVDKRRVCFSLCRHHQEGIYDGNDSSLVLYMTTTGPSFLFTGDMEEEGERRNFFSEYGQSDFGSIHFESGASWQSNIKYRAIRMHLRPELTIFSAGRNNRYGHPHPEVVETFSKIRGLPTMSTAESGSITVTVKKDVAIKFRVDEQMKKRSLHFLEGNASPFFHQTY